MILEHCPQSKWRVTPYAGVWIEIFDNSRHFLSLWSLPTRECGLKYILYQIDVVTGFVTPYAGVWIEIDFVLDGYEAPNVTPYAGVWIEISRGYHRSDSI